MQNEQPTVPTPLFKSPVIGWSLEQIRGHFVNKTKEGKFTSFVFIVLDERSEPDETCQLVSILPLDFSDNLELARSDFYVPVEALIHVEKQSMRLNEGSRNEWRNSKYGGEFLYTKERMIELMGPDFDMRDSYRVAEPTSCL